MDRQTDGDGDVATHLAKAPRDTQLMTALQRLWDAALAAHPIGPPATEAEAGGIRGHATALTSAVSLLAQFFETTARVEPLFHAARGAFVSRVIALASLAAGESARLSDSIPASPPDRQLEIQLQVAAHVALARALAETMSYFSAAAMEDAPPYLAAVLASAPTLGRALVDASDFIFQGEWERVGQPGLTDSVLFANDALPNYFCVII